MKQNQIIHWLKTTNLSLSHISNECGISRTTLHNWMNGSHKIRTRNLDRVFSVFREEIELTESKLKLKGGLKLDNQTIKSVTRDSNDNEIDASYVLNLQKNEINRLNSENQTLKGDVKKLEGLHQTLFKDIHEYDYETITTMNVKNPFKITRTINSITNLDVVAEKTGYSMEQISCFFMVGQEFEEGTHPIEGLMHKESVSYVNGLVKNLPALFNALKHMIGNHYIPIALSYKHKNGSIVNTMNYCSVNWDTRKIETKAKFLV